MSDKDVVNLGKVLAAVAQLETQVGELRKTTQHLATQVMKLTQQIKRLPCMDPESDTDPDCPAVLSDMPSHRERLHSVTEDEPDSVVTRPISVHAGQFALRGPGIMVGIVVVLLGAIGAAVLVLHPMIAQAWH